MIKTNVHSKLKQFLALFLFFVFAGMLFIGTSHAQGKEREKESKEIEVLYYDKSKGVKVIKKKDFLLKIEKNQKGLKIVHELGPYPAAYPEDLPEPKTHIDEE